MNDPVNAEKGRALKKDAPIEIEPGTKKILVEAHIVGTDKRAKKFFDVPWPEEETPEQQALKANRLKIEKAKLAKELAGLQKRPSNLETEIEKAKLRLEVAKLSLQAKELEKTPSALEKKIDEARLRLEVSKLTSQVEELSKKPSALEQSVADAKLKVELAEAEKRIRNAAEEKKEDPELAVLQRDLEIARLKNQIRETTKTEPPKKPAEIIPHICGVDGDYEVTWEVLAADKSPVPKVTLIISDPSAETNRCIKLSPTDEGGMAGQKVAFTSKEKILTASAGGGVSVWINLFNKGGK